MDYETSSAPPPPPSSIASRFSSETSLNEAKATREAEWKAAYAKLGQEPPPREEPDGTYDGRSLWEKLQEHKDKKQEAFDEQIKFKNQFRALDEDEISFLDSLVDDNTEEEDRKAKQIKEELKSFRQAVISRQALPPPSSLPIASTSYTPSTSAPVIAPTVKKAISKKKKTLPGLIVKKKSTLSTTAPVATIAGNSEESEKRKVISIDQREGEEDDAKKKRRVESNE